ncbi:MAG: hypothetical protein LUC20_07435 [Oscillospiraceae bacterium]|nr:hypothetical protein [Oscillospiraceae bacterium]
MDEEMIFAPEATDTEAAEAQVPESAEPNGETAESAALNAARDADIRAFLDAVPDADVKNLPEAVWAGVRSGKSLLTAYLLNENAALKAEAEKRSGRALSAGSAASAGASAAADFDALWYGD